LHQLSSQRGINEQHTEVSVNEETSSHQPSTGNSIEFPPFLRKEAIRKERVYVSKGSVITQYEDDMDVPTFLRKQMQ
jgi:hypothetical protein